MAIIETLRPDLTEPPVTLDAPAPHTPATFLADRPAAERLTDLLAFALAAEAAEAPTLAVVAARRAEAAAALHDYAFVHLHNRVQEVRQEAVTEHLGRLRRPPGFLTLVAANLVAVLLLAAAALWLFSPSGPLAGLAR